jgi:hypothetical protein
MMNKKEIDSTAKKGVGQTCDYCKKKIKSDDRFVLLGTYHKGEAKEEVFFHIKCWRDYYQGSIKVNQINLKQLVEKAKKYGKFLPQSIQVDER